MTWFDNWYSFMLCILFCCCCVNRVSIKMKSLFFFFSPYMFATAEDPCYENSCDGNADCSPLGDGYRCTCGDGYQGDGYSCQGKVNEYGSRELYVKPSFTTWKVDILNVVMEMIG